MNYSIDWDGPGERDGDPTLAELLAGAEAALRTPVPIGTLYGQIVYLNPWDRTLTFSGQTCSVDHPYLIGTKIHAAALEFMGNQPRGLSAGEAPVEQAVTPTPPPSQ